MNGLAVAEDWITNYMVLKKPKGVANFHNSTTPKIAAREGFEPSDPFRPTVFQAVAINHSAISGNVKSFPEMI